jgi:prepilin-type N-terminal cleavage/methylation domain-containing protein
LSAFSVARRRGFTLLEALLVLVVMSLLIATALPDWRAVHKDALIRDAQMVLNRIDLQQRQFRQRYARYALKNELPDLTAFSKAVSQHYRLEVEVSGSEYVLRLIGRGEELPTLTLDHAGAGDPAPIVGT